jgi:hypothetical protein
MDLRAKTKRATAPKKARVAIKQTQLAEAPHPLAMVLLQRGEQVHQPWRIMSNLELPRFDGRVGA